MKSLKFLLILSIMVAVLPAQAADSTAPAKPAVQAKPKLAVRVFVAASDNSVFKRIDSSTIQFVKGNLLVSVKPPMKSATVQTPFGTVIVPSDSVVYVSLANGELQVQHLHGATGSNVNATLKSGLFKNATEQPLTIGVGQHMTGSVPVRLSVPTKEAVPPLPTPVPMVSTMNQTNLQATGRTINSMAGNMPNLASRKRFAAMTKTPLIDDYVDDFNFNSVDNATGSDTSTSITSPNDIPSTDISPADSFQTARENVQQGEFQPEAATQEDDSGLAEMFGTAEAGTDMDATGGMLEPGDGLQ